MRCALAASLLAVCAAWPATAQRFDGVNVIAMPAQPFGSAAAKLALARAQRIGARTVAVVPFLWQPTPSSADVGRGNDMSDDMLRAALRDVHALGLSSVVKPHVWVPTSWAGAVAMDDEAAWRVWFANYGGALRRIATIAAEEGATLLAIGTELERTTHRPEWNELIAALRAIFPGLLTYVAHNAEEAESIAFWDRLDVVGVSLYPPLGDGDDRAGRLAVMRNVGERLDALAARTGKSVLVAEVGLRSARGATRKPWESAEEREAPPDPILQSEVLADWLSVLDRPSIQGVLVWRWFTDPDAGGSADTDFTVQGKPAEGVLLCAWTRACRR